MSMHRRSASGEEGIALILAMFMVLAVSMLGASLVSVGRSETMSSLNYKTLAQARYAAESGLNSAANYLIYTYTAPGNDAADPMAAFVYENTSPVTTLDGNPVVLSTNMDKSNYPIESKKKAFHDRAMGELTMSRSKANYTATATLVSMRKFKDAYTLTDVTVQTWSITGSGTLEGAGAADVEVTAVIETQAVPTFRYAAFAAYKGCKALSFGGGGSTDSYDSSDALDPVTHLPTKAANGGNVGTNGNLDEVGATTVIKGTLSTPRSGVGNCTTNNVTALSFSTAQELTDKVNGGLVELPQVVPEPDPAQISPAPPTTATSLNKTGGCPAGVTNCAMYFDPSSGNKAGVTLTPAAGVAHSLGDVKLTGGMELHLGAGTYEWNSISITGSAKIVIDSGPVIFKIAGKDQTSPIDLTGSSVSNKTYKPENFQIIYAPPPADIAAIEAGTLNKNVKVAGGSEASMLVYAPRADGTITGGSDLYGAIIFNKVKDMGGTTIHYDRNLQRSAYTSGNPTITSFSWNVGS